MKLTVLDDMAWFLAPALSVPLAAVVYTVLWPCFIAARVDTRFPPLLAATIIPTYIALTIPSQRSVTSRLKEATITAVVCGIFSSVLLSNVAGAVDSGRQKATMVTMRRAAGVVAVISREVPLSALAKLPEWRQLAASDKQAIGDDGWGNPILVAIQGNNRYVVSLGACGKCDVESVLSYRVEPTQSYEADIVMKNGLFIRYPEDVQY